MAQVIPIQGFNPPLGPLPTSSGVYMPQQVTLSLQERLKTISGNDFTVRTLDGVAILKIQGVVFSASGRSTFTDLAGQPLFDLRHKLFRIPMSFYSESPAGHNFEIKGHFKMLGFRSTVHFRNASDGQQVEMNVEGNMMNREVKMTINGRPVATVSRDLWNARQMLGGSSTYYVTVAPGVDLSLITAICVSLDERARQNASG